MLNQKIKALRLEHGYSQTYVARVLGITRSAYSMYEKGIRTPNYTTIITLADIYQVSTDYIFGRTDNKNLYK